MCAKRYRARILRLRHRLRLSRRFGKRLGRLPPTEGTSPRHSSLLTVIVCLSGGIRAEAVLDTAASGPVVNPGLVKKIVTLKCKTKAKISQADGGPMKGGTHVVNTSFKFLSQKNHTNVNDLLDFSFDAEVLDIGQ